MRRAEAQCARSRILLYTEEALERGNRELERRIATTGARGRERDNTVGVRGVLGVQQGGTGGKSRRANTILDQDDVEVLEVVVRHHSDEAVEEVRDVAEEDIEEVVEEAEAGREVVELVEEVDDEGEVEHIGVDEADMVEGLRGQGGDLVDEAEVDQVMVEAQDDTAEGAQNYHAEPEVAQEVEVDGSAEPPLSDTIDLTDSPQPSRR